MSIISDVISKLSDLLTMMTGLKEQIDDMKEENKELQRDNLIYEEFLKECIEEKILSQKQTDEVLESVLEKEKICDNNI